MLVESEIRGLIIWIRARHDTRWQIGSLLTDDGIESGVRSAFAEWKSNVIRPAYVEQQSASGPRRKTVVLLGGDELTLLDEFKAISDVALVGYEEEATIVQSLVRGSLLGGDFGSELNAMANDTMGFGSCRANVGPRSGLAGMRCVWTSFLRQRVIAEVVIPR